jgi:hypothetical protein
VPKKVFETLVEVAGIEPDTLCDETSVNIKDSDFSVEALIKILTKISGTDRQMLSQIVKRWGSLSDELKRAVLRVVG